MIRNYEHAADLMDEYLRINPTKGSAWMTMAYYDAKLGRFTQAESALKRAETVGASTIEDQFTKAQTLAALGRKSEAKTLLTQCEARRLSSTEVQLALDLKDLH
jgi:tetratricopeptide (TPR) repeat protein